MINIDILEAGALLIYLLHVWLSDSNFTFDDNFLKPSAKYCCEGFEFIAENCVTDGEDVAVCYRGGQHTGRKLVIRTITSRDLCGIYELNSWKDRVCCFTTL